MKVYVAAISSNHTDNDVSTVGSHNLAYFFLRGPRKLHSPAVLQAPDWELPLVLDAQRHPPFEPLPQADLKWLM